MPSRPEQQDDTNATRITLIQRIQSQYDEDAWAEFADVYSRYIYAIIRSMRISAHDAEEIHQQIIVKLWKVLPELDLNKIRRFRSYLSTITKNEVLQFIRSEKRRLERETIASCDSALDYLNAIRVSEIERIAEAEWRTYLTNMALRQIADKFSAKAIEAFRLSIHGMEPEDIATKMNLTVKSVQTFKSRVRGHFTAELKQLRDNLE